MNLRMCGGCRRNGLVSDADYEFCLFCETVFPMGIRVQKRSNFHVSNKLIHLRNVLRRLLSKQCSEEVIRDLRAMMDRHQIRPEDVDANYVSSFLKDSEMINKKDYKLVFEIINQVKTRSWTSAPRRSTRSSRYSSSWSSSARRSRPPKPSTTPSSWTRSSRSRA